MIQPLIVSREIRTLWFRNLTRLIRLALEPQQRRSLDRVPAKIADLSRSGIHENRPALGINNRFVAECSAESVKR